MNDAAMLERGRKLEKELTRLIIQLIRTYDMGDEEEDFFEYCVIMSSLVNVISMTLDEFVEDDGLEKALSFTEERIAAGVRKRRNTH